MLAEISTGFAFVAGWIFLTWALVDVTSPTVWKVSAGALLVSLGGWRLLGRMIWRGLYELTRDGDDA